MRAGKTRRKSAEESTGKNSRTESSECGNGTAGGRYLQMRRNRRCHRVGYREISHQRDATLGADVRRQGLELGDRFVMPHVAAAAGGLVDQERDKNRHAKRNGEPDLPTSPHRADSMRRYRSGVKLPALAL